MDFDRDLPKWLDQLGRLLPPEALLVGLGHALWVIPTLLALGLIALLLVW